MTSPASARLTDREKRPVASERALGEQPSARKASGAFPLARPAQLPGAAAAQAERIIAHHSKSFSLAAWLLPGAVRSDAVMLYAYCRHVDDAIDTAPEAEQPAALARLRAELEDVYAGRPLADPLLAAFGELVERRRIPRCYPEELLNGMEMDVRGTRYTSLEQLLAYCYRVAATVGLMMCHVMGVRRDSALLNAAHLGIAMQLTNIARDVHEDWQRGRLYLPERLIRARDGDLLQRKRASGLRTFPHSAAPQVAEATGTLLELAERFYRSGDAGLDALSPRCELGVRAARLIYSRIGRELQARGCDPLAGRAVVARWKKLLLLGRAACATLLSVPRSLRHRTPRAPQRLLALQQAVALPGGRR